MAKIIEAGVPPEDREYRAKCENCETVFEFEGREIMKTSAGGYLHCPVCLRPFDIVFDSPTQISNVKRVK